MTNYQKFTAIAAIMPTLEGSVFEIDGEDVTITAEVVEDFVTFCEKQKDSITKKNAKAAETARAKRAQNDQMVGVVQSVLTADWMTKEEIVAAVAEAVKGTELEDAKVTPGVIVSRMKKLVDSGIAQKGTAKSEETGKNVTVYALL